MYMRSLIFRSNSHTPFQSKKRKKFIEADTLINVVTVCSSFHTISFILCTH